MRRHPGTGAEGSRVTVNGPPSQREPQGRQAMEKSFLAGHCLRLMSIR